MNDTKHITIDDILGKEENAQTETDKAAENDESVIKDILRKFKFMEKKLGSVISGKRNDSTDDIMITCAKEIVNIIKQQTVQEFTHEDEKLTVYNIFGTYCIKIKGRFVDIISLTFHNPFLGKNYYEDEEANTVYNEILINKIKVAYNLDQTESEKTDKSAKEESDQKPNERKPDYDNRTDEEKAGFKTFEESDQEPKPDVKKISDEDYNTGNY